MQSYPEDWRESEVPGDHQAKGANDNNPIDQPVSTLQQLLSSLSSTSPHKIHEACLAGDLDRIKQLVKAGASINAPGTFIVAYCREI